MASAPPPISIETLLAIIQRLKTKNGNFNSLTDQEHSLFELYAQQNSLTSASAAYLYALDELTKRQSQALAEAEAERDEQRRRYEQELLEQARNHQGGASGGGGGKKPPSLAKITALVSSKESFNALTAAERAILQSYADSVEFKGKLEELFESIKTSLQQVAEAKAQAAVIDSHALDPAVLARLIAEFEASEADTDPPHQTTLPDQIKRALEYQRLLAKYRIAQELAKKPEYLPTQKEVSEAVTQIDPKTNPHDTIFQLCLDTVTATASALPQVDQTSHEIEPVIVRRAAQTLQQLLILDLKIANLDTPTPLDSHKLVELTQIALALEDSQIDTPLARYIHEIQANTRPATTADFQPPTESAQTPNDIQARVITTRTYNPTTNLIVDAPVILAAPLIADIENTTNIIFDTVIATPSNADAISLDTCSKLTTTNFRIISRAVEIPPIYQAAQQIASLPPDFVERLVQAINQSDLTPLATPRSVTVVTALETVVQRDSKKGSNWLTPLSASQPPIPTKQSFFRTPLTAQIAAINALGTLTTQQITDFLEHPTSNPKLQALERSNPAAFNQIIHAINIIRSSPLVDEVSPQNQRVTPTPEPPLSKTLFDPILRIFSPTKSKQQATTTSPQTSTNLNNVFSGLRRQSSLLEKSFNRIPLLRKYTTPLFHPVHYFQNWIAQKAGERLGRQILVRFSAPLLRHEFSRLASQTIIKQGLSQGLRTVTNKAAIKFSQIAATQAAKLGAKIGVDLAIKGGLTATGVGIPVVILLQVAEIGLSLIKKAWGVVQSISVKLFGQKIKARHIILAPLVIAAGFFGVMAAGAASLLAGLALTLGISSFIAFIIFVSAFNLGPIIGSLAQIGPFQDPGSYIGLPPDPGSNYTYNDPTTRVQCFTFDNAIYPWPDQIKQPIVSSVNTIDSGYSNYMNRLCRYLNRETDISLQFGGYSSLGYGGYVPRLHTIVIYSNYPNLFTLSHETGHIYNQRYPATYQSFRLDQGVIQEGFLPSYRFGSSYSEDFAETIGKYIGDSSYLNRYPEHRRFARDNIFN